MKKKTFICLFLITYFFLASCSSPKGNDFLAQEATIINLDSATIETFKYSTFFNTAKIIPLSTKEVLLSNIHKMSIIKDTFFLIDKRTESVYSFRKDGSFIQKFGNHGPAPGEYTNCSDFTIDPANRKLFIYDAIRQKILRYDLPTGTFEEEIALSNHQDYSHIHYQSGYLYAVQPCYNPDVDSKFYLLHQINLQTGKDTGKMLDANIYNQGWQNEPIGQSNPPFFPMEGETWFCTGLMNTVMVLKDGTVNPVMAIHGKQVVRKEDIPEEDKRYSPVPTTRSRQLVMQFMRLNQQEKFFGFSNFFVHRDNVWFECNGGSRLSVRYDLKNKDTHIYNRKVDDIFLQKKVNRTLPSYLCADSTGIYYCYTTEQIPELKHLLENGYLSDKVVNKELINQLDSESNPVLLYYEFKK